MPDPIDLVDKFKKYWYIPTGVVIAVTLAYHLYVKRKKEQE